MSGSFFSQAPDIALDPIMAIDELFRNDPAPNKINLVVGVFQNEAGETPVLECVKDAERDLVRTEASKSYLPMAGEPTFADAAERLILGAEAHRIAERYVTSIQTPGSTGALRIAAELIKDHSRAATVWMSTPVYSNHKPIFHAAGLQTANYRYFDVTRGTLAFDEMLTDLREAQPGNVVLIHACCHNPSGADLSVSQWQQLAEFLRERSLLPMIDAAYLGLGIGVEQDSAGMRRLATVCPETIIASSFSKNFALYSERVGLLSLTADKASTVQAFAQEAKVHVRRLYTSPPSHGAKIVARVLTDESLRTRWLAELASMQQKLSKIRKAFADALESHGVSADLFPAVRQNRGMFTLSRLNPSQISRLRDEHHIYMLDTGRVSFGGMREAHFPQLAAAIADVTHSARIGN